MLTEKLIKWEPSPEVAGVYRFQGFTRTEINDFTIFLVDINNSKKYLEIVPKGIVLSYRKTEESPVEESCWGFCFKVANSEFVQFLVGESCGIFLAKDFQHYVFITTDSKIEIVCGREPLITVVSKKSLSD